MVTDTRRQCNESPNSFSSSFLYNVRPTLHQHPALPALPPDSQAAAGTPSSARGTWPMYLHRRQHNARRRIKHRSGQGAAANNLVEVNEKPAGCRTDLSWRRGTPRWSLSLGHHDDQPVRQIGSLSRSFDQDQRSDQAKVSPTKPSKSSRPTIGQANSPWKVSNSRASISLGIG